MKKTISYLLISCLFFAFNLTPAFASSNEDHSIENIVFQENSSVNERVINTLDENGIEYTIEENNIILKNFSWIGGRSKRFSRKKLFKWSKLTRNYH